MKKKFISLKDMSEVFCDLELIPRGLVKNYYLLLCDFMNKKYLTKNSIIFKNLMQCIESLYPKRRQYIILKYGLLSSKMLTLSEIGELYGVTGESVRQVLEKSFNELNGAKIKFYAPHRIGYLKRRKEEIDEEIEYLNKITSTSKVVIPTIDNFDFSIRARNALKKAHITTYEELMQLTPKKLKSIKNVGIKTANEIWFKLHGENLPSKSILNKH